MTITTVVLGIGVLSLAFLGGVLARVRFMPPPETQTVVRLVDMNTHSWIQWGLECDRTAMLAFLDWAREQVEHNIPVPLSAKTAGQPDRQHAKDRDQDEIQHAGKEVSHDAPRP